MTPNTAEQLFDEFLGRLEDGEEPDFESFVEAHADHAADLREMYSAWRVLDTRLTDILPGPVEDGEAEALMDASAIPAPLAAHEEQVFGDYRLIRKIGQGAMGQVWEAEQLSLGRHVALKLLRPEKETAGRVKAFGREARAGGRLQHPGIATVYAAGTIDGVPYIAQQLVEGGATLSDLIGRLRQLERPDYTAIAELFAKVADALHAAHQEGILHRDLKPPNILLAPGDVPLVSDFGLAHLADETTLAARPGLIGTFPYMSPEQAAGKDITIDRRSDVFSLGAVLFETLTLRRAFEGDAGPQIVDRILHAELPDPRTIRSRVPGDLAVICLKALAKHRTERYATMADFAEDLRRFLRHEPIRARPPSPIARAGKWMVRHPAWSTAIGLVAVALVVISALLVREVDLRQKAQFAETQMGISAKAEAEAAKLAEQRAREATEQSYFAGIRAASLDLDRGEHAEARRRLAATAPDLRGWEWDHYALRADTSLRRLAGHALPITAVSVSADGSVYVTASEDGSVIVWDARTGMARATLSGHAGPVRGVAVSDDGAVVVSGSDDATVRIWNGSSGTLDAVLRGHEGIVRAVAISADGSHVMSGSDDGRALVWKDLDADPVELPDGRRFGIVSVGLSSDGSRAVMSTRHGTTSYWDTSTGARIWELPWDSANRVVVALDAVGTRVFVGAIDGTITVWDHGQKEPTRVLAAHDLPVTSLACSGDGLRLVSACAEDHTVSVWDVVTGDPITSLTGHDGRVADVAISRDGTRVLAGCSDATATAWDGRPICASNVVATLAPPATLLAASSTGARLVTASLPQDVLRVWDGEGGGELGVLTGHRGTVTAVDITADGSRIVSGSFDRTVRLWDAETGEVLEVLTGHASGVNAVATDATGTRVVSSGHDRTLRVWDLPSGRSTIVGSPDGGAVTSVDISADGRLAAGAALGGTVFIWDGELTVLREGEGAQDGLVSLSADGSRLGWAPIDEDHIQVWDVEAGTILAEMSGYRSGVTTLSLSADGRRVASTSAGDTGLRLWDAASGESLALLAGHAGPVSALVFTGDGRRLVSAAADGTLRIWESDHATAHALSLAVGGN